MLAGGASQKSENSSSRQSWPPTRQTRSPPRSGGARSGDGDELSFLNPPDLDFDDDFDTKNCSAKNGFCSTDFLAGPLDGGLLVKILIRSCSMDPWCP